MASISKLKSGRWRVRVRHKGYKSESATFQTKSEAKAWAIRAEGMMALKQTPKIDVLNNCLTLEEAIKRYIEFEAPKRKGCVQIINRANAWLNHPISQRPLTRIRAYDLSQIVEDRLAAGRNMQTIRNDFQVISGVYKMAIQKLGFEELKNPMDNLSLALSEAPAEQCPEERERLLLPGEEDLLLETANTRLQSIIIIAIETAMRAGEIRALRLVDVNLSQRVVHLQKTKNGSKRKIPLSSRACDAFLAIRADRAGLLLNDLTASALSHQFRKLCKKKGIEQLRFHDLRHEATTRLSKRYDIFDLARITGHKTLGTLLRYYHADANELAKRLP